MRPLRAVVRNSSCGNRLLPSGRTQRPEGTGRYALLAAVVGADEAPVRSDATIPTRSPCSKTAEGGGACQRAAPV